MKLRMALFFSCALLIALPQGLRAMEIEDDETPLVNNKQKEKEGDAPPVTPPDPVKTEDGWWNQLDTKKKVALGATGAVAVGAATSSTVRDTLRSWIWNPFANKCAAIKKNGFAKELVTKPMLGTAALATGAFLGYKWHNMTPQERAQKREDTYAMIQNNKGTLLVGAAALTALGIGYKLITASDKASEGQVPQDLKIASWFKEAASSLPVDQQKKLEQTLRIQHALANPNLFLINDEGIQAALEKNIVCPLEPEWFIAFLTPAHKKALLDIIRDYNEESFKALKQSIVLLFDNADFIKQVQAIKTPQELVELMNTKEAQPFFKEASKKAYDKIKELSLDYSVIYFSCQEQFAASLGRVSFGDNLAPKKTEKAAELSEQANLDSLQMVYSFAGAELINSFNQPQRETLKQAKIEALEVIMSNPNQLKSNQEFYALLNEGQKQLLEQLIELYAGLSETHSKLYA
jgi:hypothetical protein